MSDAYPPHNAELAAMSLALGAEVAARDSKGVNSFMSCLGHLINALEQKIDRSGPVDITKAPDGMTSAPATA